MEDWDDWYGIHNDMEDRFLEPLDNDCFPLISNNYVKCKYCGKLFKWEKRDDKYVLVTKAGNIHSCLNLRPMIKTRPKKLSIEQIGKALKKLSKAQQEGKD